MVWPGGSRAPSWGGSGLIAHPAAPRERRLTLPLKGASGSPKCGGLPNPGGCEKRARGGARTQADAARDVSGGELGGGAWLHRTLQCGGGNRFPFVLFAGTVGTAGVAHCALTLETPYLTLGLGPCQQGPRMRCRGSTLLVWPGVGTIVDSEDSLSFTIAGCLPPMCIPRTVPITSSRKATPESTPRLLRVPIFPSG